MSFTRFAVFYLPPEGALADFGAGWLGWDVARGKAAPRLDLPGLDAATLTPRKYGFHGTLKPPFRLVEGRGPVDLATAVERLAGTLAPARCAGLQIRCLGRFLALTPKGPSDALARIASLCVRELDGFRAPAGEAELARRRKAGLSQRQEALLTRWGYPYVMEEFRFHLTLTGNLQADALAQWRDTASAHLPCLPAPFPLDEVALVGERQDGRFELIQRYALTG
ncbi:MAG: DUF1045 domain-containing protein [Rhodospirillales bacterium]